MGFVEIAETGEHCLVGKIIGIGANYDSHNREMGRNRRVEAILFLKPSTALVREGDPIVIPSFSTEVHHELELVLMIGMGGKRIPAAEAASHIRAVGVGLDMTARDLQQTAKQHGLPWSMAKGFDTSAAVSSFIPVDELDDLDALRFNLTVNGETRQQGSAEDMILGPAALVAYASTFFTLEPGDLIFTGTPEGVGSVQGGDELVLTLEDHTTAAFHVQEELDVEKC